MYANEERKIKIQKYMGKMHSKKTTQILIISDLHDDNSDSHKIGCSLKSHCSVPVSDLDIYLLAAITEFLNLFLGRDSWYMSRLSV